MAAETISDLNVFSGDDSSKESHFHFTIYDFAVFIGMLAASSGIGIYFAYKNRKNHSNKDFLTSNKSLSLFPVAMSLLASFQSSVTILGYPAEMFYRGTQFWMVILSSLAASMIAAELFLPVFYRLNFTSVNQYLEQRFNSTKVRLAVSFSFLLCTVPYMGVVLYGPSLALETVTGLSVTASILIIGSICTLYTSMGGIKAVVWTDVVQVFLMFAGLLVVMIRGFYLVGGISEAFKIASKHNRIQFFNHQIDIYSTTTFWNCVIGMGTMWSGNYATSQTEVQRYCNVTTQRKAKLSLYVNFLGVAFLISCACLCGIALFGVYADCDPLRTGAITKTDQLMPHFVMNHLSHMPGMAGLFVSCVFSASLSTMSSGFNALATVTYDDFLSRTRVRKLPERKIQQISKLIAFCYGMAAIAMAFVVSEINSILEAAISIAGALVGPMFGLFLCGILIPFTNAFGVLCGLLGGELFGIWVLIGSLMYLKPAQMLDTSTECPAEKLVESLFSNATTTMAPNIDEKREGLIKLYHISYLLVPVFGCIISLVLGVVCSLISNGHKNSRRVRPEFLSPYAWLLWPKSFLPQDRPYSQNQDREATIPNGALPLNGDQNNNMDQKKAPESSISTYLQANGKYPKYSAELSTSKPPIISTISIESTKENSNDKDNNSNNRPPMLSRSKQPKIVKQNAVELDDVMNGHHLQANSSNRHNYKPDDENSLRL